MDSEQRKSMYELAEILGVDAEKVPWVMALVTVCIVRECDRVLYEVEDDSNVAKSQFVGQIMLRMRDLVTSKGTCMIAIHILGNMLARFDLTAQLVLRISMKQSGVVEDDTDEVAASKMTLWIKESKP